MKKIKIMLLSLALFAIVGGALAFKAKLGDQKFCTTSAYFDINKTPSYYCSFEGSGGVVTTQCLGLTQSGTFPAVGDLKVCTTTPLPPEQGGGCPVTCENITTWIKNN